jgi:predicted anti-sigma-YlaC factor YlaD
VCFGIFQARESFLVILHRKSVLSLIATAVVLLTAVSAHASITGSISGTVTDPSGAVLVGVKVTATSASTAIESSAATDAKGFYRFPVLSVDTYGVAVNQSGFRPFLGSGVKIDANSALQFVPHSRNRIRDSRFQLSHFICHEVKP